MATYRSVHAEHTDDPPPCQQCDWRDWMLAVVLVLTSLAVFGLVTWYVLGELR
ncbi:MAG: hypothetical protein ACRDT6_04280 [Micromonosporaceae bacterium]